LSENRRSEAEKDRDFMAGHVLERNQNSLARPKLWLIARQRSEVISLSINRNTNEFESYERNLQIDADNPVH
jgi:hypothetical protein